MKNIILITITIISISACNKHELREIKDPISGQLLEQFQVVENKEGSFIKDGFYKTWFKNGQIESKGLYAENKKDGLWKYWHSNGQIKSEYSFKQDSLDGILKKWYDNSQLSINGKYNNGKLVGEWLTYHDNGQLMSKENYSNGLKQGLFTSWYMNGQKASKEMYSDGVENGLWSYWDQDGLLNKQEKYKNGKNIILIGGKWIDKDKDEWQFFEDGTYILTLHKSEQRKKGTWSISNNYVKLNDKSLKIKYVSADSVFATRWVKASFWSASYEAQRLQAKHISDSTAMAH